MDHESYSILHIHYWIKVHTTPYESYFMSDETILWHRKTFDWPFSVPIHGSSLYFSKRLLWSTATDRSIYEQNVRYVRCSLTFAVGMFERFYKKNFGKRKNLSLMFDMHKINCWINSSFLISVEIKNFRIFSTPTQFRSALGSTRDRGTAHFYCPISPR